MLSDSQEDRQKRLADMLSFVRQRAAEEKEAEAKPPAKKTKTTSGGSSPSVRSVPKAALPDYKFEADNQIAQLKFALRPEIEVRPYQNEALDAIVDRSGDTPQARSGIIVLPCGAGKSLTSILVACALQKPVLVVCSTIIAAEQFSKEFLRFTDLMASRTGMFAGSKKWPYNGPSGVLFTTYTMLVDSKNRTADSKRMSQFIDKTEWGLIILDEVHCVPANNFSKAISKIKARVRLGLTATMLREDEKIGDLETLVGPTLYHAKWKELADRGYIAKVICTQVEMDMPLPIREAYESIQSGTSGGVLGHAHHMKSLLAILNPKKVQLCQRLVQYHEARGDKVLVYCDHIDALKLYAKAIDRPFIYGGTPTDEARQLLERFQIDVQKVEEGAKWSEVAAYRAKKAKQINTILLSRIGDTSLDLPAATVLIQVSSHFGSRRQEAQRLGRVLRAKKRNEKGFYSRFYTLVTVNTHEVSFSEKRRQFLEEDCGYGYQIWQIGDENPETGGWHAETHVDSNSPDDDEVKIDPVTCMIGGADERPYVSEDDQLNLVRFIRGLKNIQVEEEEEESVSPTNVSVGTKRKK
ncbi:hypothetical protein EC973_005870 [Apophysomyces ossiformis]|uniref:DNA 3'-5' helicase n=1 Tax=Apophysomyces ossiformis TaxID=679940 RepID=A0A8H7EP96_9FUNG|nr:hypothetical protein EC973_005870 [Apophysomyces ossiformis]